MQKPIATALIVGLTLVWPLTSQAEQTDQQAAFCETVERLIAERSPRPSLGKHARVILPDDLRTTGEGTLGGAIAQAPSTSRFALERRAERECPPA